VPKTKTIYRYVNRLVAPCKWCQGTGRNRFAFTDEKCFTCKGTGGKRKKVKELVGKEVIAIS
jgi:DnaJ-class molecular chaperone